MITDYALKQTHLNTSKVTNHRYHHLSAAREKYWKKKTATGAISFVRLATQMDYFCKKWRWRSDRHPRWWAGKNPPFGKLEIRQGDYVVIPQKSLFTNLNLKKGRCDCWSWKPTSGWNRKTLSQMNWGNRVSIHRIMNAIFVLRRNWLPIQGKGEFLLKIKKQGFLHQYVYEHSPLDLIWDFFLWPYAFSIHDFEPITGRIHQPPPVHQTFQAHNFVICCSCPACSIISSARDPGLIITATSTAMKYRIMPKETLWAAEELSADRSHPSGWFTAWPASGYGREKYWRERNARTGRNDRHV